MLNKNETSNTLTLLFYNMLKRAYCELLELLAYLLRWPIGAKHNAIPVKKHNNLFQNTTIFCRTQQYFREHNNLFENKIQFDGTEQSLAQQKSLSENTTIFSRTKQFDRTTIFSRTRHNLIEHKRKLINNKIN